MILKPDWKDAPLWVNYLCMDADLTWWWFEEKPALGGMEWYALKGRSKRAWGEYSNPPDWKTTLEKKPGC